MPGAAEPYAQLKSQGLAYLVSLCRLLGSAPRRVMARCNALTRSSEVFLELGNGVQIQYFGSIAAQRPQQRLWIEGPRGSLLHQGALRFWRKKGWPKFLPWGFAWKARSGDAGAAEQAALLRAIQRSHEEHRVIELGV